MEKLKAQSAVSSTQMVRCGEAIHRLGREEREVRIMAVSEGYAMVRRKGMIPYIADVKELSMRKHIQAPNDQAHAPVNNPKQSL